MRYIAGLSVIILFLLSLSCRHKPHGPGHMTHEDSLRRAADILVRARLAAMDTIREEFEGPLAPGTGTGEVSRGGKLRVDQFSDSAKQVIRSFGKFSDRIDNAEQDSTTVYGTLMSRFKILDSQHKYLSATYSSDGHLLTFHSEVTEDDKHKQDYDFYFDQGRLRYIHERRSYTAGEDDQNMLAEDSYFMSGAAVLYCYRDEGYVQQRDVSGLIHLTRYTLRGDIDGHVARAFAAFQKDYELLLSQPLELMVYTSPGKTGTPEGPAPDKKAGDRHSKPSF